jgi:hypothetical protein
VVDRCVRSLPCCCCALVATALSRFDDRLPMTGYRWSIDRSSSTLRHSLLSLSILLLLLVLAIVLLILMVTVVKSKDR